jgi:hypothetical protein
MTEINKDSQEPLNQVFQGKMMRENTTFWEKVFYSYAKPLLDSSMTQQIRFEQYGELPDRLKVCHEAENLESSIQHFIKKNPQDRYAFLKGIFRANKGAFAKFGAVRCFLTA